ncbi:BAR adaptor protein Hob3 [Claviceps pazoutovae]|uniref:BAR adaptor protein Hob3 n=1 Tax=Claviceps pazoutovae TaxID=1649127 RepID=A0A9P7M9Q0_9HYPO|nr:BAR adaptor protein Hob3 [Claviceps pazoutovae]
MTASQMRIAETMDSFYGESGASDGVSRSYKEAVGDLDAETIKALDGPYRTPIRSKKEEQDSISYVEQLSKKR